VARWSPRTDRKSADSPASLPEKAGFTPAFLFGCDLSRRSSSLVLPKNNFCGARNFRSGSVIVVSPVGGQ
jgi:hypothetical protein